MRRTMSRLSALAACQAASGALNDAIISYEQVVMMDTNASNAYNELGDIYYKQGNSAAAAKNYKRYFVKNPADLDVAEELAKFAFENQEYPDVIKYLAMLQFKTDEDMECGMMYASAAIAENSIKTPSACSNRSGRKTEAGAVPPAAQNSGRGLRKGRTGRQCRRVLRFVQRTPGRQRSGHGLQARVAS